MPEQVKSDNANPIPFKAETQQLLNILIHSLYTEREIFLRELISNASDALSRLDYLMLTERDVLNADLPLEIHLKTDQENGLLIIEDTGIGMTKEELSENLGTIARSGAKAFVEAAQENKDHLSDIIGQFGVGFYSAFMVADWIRVISRSYQPDAQAAAWFATGEDTYTLETAEREKRGTEIQIKLKEDAQTFLEESRLRQIVKRHSDFINYPITINDDEQPINQQTALWRQNPLNVEEEAYHEFYKQLTLDFTNPLTQTHMMVDAPAQMYALLFIPSDPQNLVFSPRKEPGLKLYARKVLIDEFCTSLLPEYLNFVEGVVDSEDLPLNVSRESVQSNRIMAHLKRLVTAKALDMMQELSEKTPEKYVSFWETYGSRLKEGVAIDQDQPEKLFPLLRFHTNQDLEGWHSLDDYLSRADQDQEAIYYILGEYPSAARFSPHMEAFRKADIEVLLLTEPVDPFMLMQLKAYQDHQLVNVAEADLPIPEADPDTEEKTELPKETLDDLITSFKKVLEEKVSDVRTTTRLSDSPARLVDPEGSPDQSVQRVYRMMNQTLEIPQKVLEINPRHPIIKGLSRLQGDHPKFKLIAQQVFDNALLVEGLHPNPISMIEKIQDLMTAALANPPEEQD